MRLHNTAHWPESYPDSVCAFWFLAHFSGAFLDEKGSQWEVCFQLLGIPSFCIPWQQYHTPPLSTPAFALSTSKPFLDGKHNGKKKRIVSTKPTCIGPTSNLVWNWLSAVLLSGGGTLWSPTSIPFCRNMCLIASSADFDAQINFQVGRQPKMSKLQANEYRGEKEQRKHPRKETCTRGWGRPMFWAT